MSGKPYSLREMKAIVDYLVEHKAYGEVKARKMWTDMQDSKITNRTWQSLKETFLKRILPDIHNPYYKLSLQQISSFKQGYDVQKKINNRLQLRATTSDSNTDGENKKKSGAPDMNKRNDITGEDLNPSKSNLRASTETLVSETIEDLTEKNENPTKVLKNLDSYDENLKSIIKEVINDFDTDEEGDEPKMQIVETISNNQSDPDDAREVTTNPLQISSVHDLYNRVDKSNKMTTKERNEEDIPSQTISVSDGESKSSEHEVESKTPKKSISISKANKNNSIIEKSKENENHSIIEKSKANENNSVIEKSKGNENNSNTENSKTPSKITPNSSNLTTDTFLPDNQEALKVKMAVNETTNTSKNYETKHRKRRATSQDNSVGPLNSKNFFLNKNKQTVSDMEINTNDKEKVDLSKYRKQKIQEVEESNAKSSNGMNQELPKDDDMNNKGLIIDEKSSPEIENACFQSRDADQITPNVENNVKQKLGDKSAVENSEKEITNSNREGGNKGVMMKSHSDSLSDSTKEAGKRWRNPCPRRHRDRALTNVFGFTSGGANRNRKRKKSFPRCSSSRNQIWKVSTDSSAWTSDSESDYVSPPRGRNNKHGRKYLKPKPARILSLEEEGGLFVMYGKKIYPLVKDGKIIKNYVNYIEEDDVDTEESFWKLKYVEEKKKTAELTKLMKQVKEKNEQEPRSPIPTTSLHISSDDNQSKLDRNPKTKSRSSENIAATKQANENKASFVDTKEVSEPGKDTVKIKFTIKNEEVELEGRSTLVNPLLAQVVQLLQKEPEVNCEKQTPKCGSVFSEKSSVVAVSDSEVKERVNKLENEIFKEIVERDLGNQPDTDNVNRKSNDKDVTPNINVVAPNEKDTRPKEIEGPPSENVTGRVSGMKRSTSSTSLKQVPEKKLKTDKESITRRSTRIAKSLTADNDDGDSSTIKSRRSSIRKSVDNTLDEDTQVKYKFPSPKQSATAKANKKEMKTNKNQRKAKSLSDHKIYTSPESVSLHSVESTQGYADSDFSPIEMAMKKRRTSFTITKYNNRKLSYRRKKYQPHVYDASDSSNSFQGPVKAITIQNSSLNSDIYKSESYRQLMDVDSVRNKEKINSRLEKIYEINSNNLDIENLLDINGNESSQPKNVICRTNTDTSSNVTLPTSPALSIVENISIDKSMLSNSDNFIYHDKEPSQDAIEKIMLNKLMKSDADVSMPLMEHQYGIQSGAQDGFEYHYTLNDPKSPTLHQSLVEQINTVNLDDPTLSETLNVKLRNMLLESNKKRQSVNSNDESNKEVQNDANVKKNKAKKRSSTPRKRQSTRKTKVINTEPCIEEEHMETCSQVSRKSCPANLHILKDADYNEGNNSIVCVELKTDKSKGKKKKDVIKVKITKPKRKRKETVHCDMSNSVQTDSGINEMESSNLLAVHNDVDLIHNHSDTCLNAHECMEDSIEIIENSTKSIISLNSNSGSINEDEYYSKLPEMMAQELFCNNAQDGTKNNPALFAPMLRQESEGASVYETPVGSVLSPSSLITEDLSDELSRPPVRNSRWYLLSEDETNTIANALDESRNTHIYANLNQIFPVTCAIPDLSTITEISKENDGNTGKLSDDTRNDLDSQSS